MEGTCSVNASESLARCGRCHLSFLANAFVDASKLKRESNLSATAYIKNKRRPEVIQLNESYAVLKKIHYKGRTLN
jgi:hypothetical protein